MPPPSIDTILQYGLLGTVCVILIWVSWQLFRLYTEAQEDKVKILREALQAAGPLAEAIKELTNSHRTLADQVKRLEDAARRG